LTLQRRRSEAQCLRSRVRTSSRIAVAAAITEPTLRQSYLDNIPEHREIELTWAGAADGSCRTVLTAPETGVRERLLYQVLYVCAGPEAVVSPLTAFGQERPFG
jgi:hypothetical protein